MTQLQHAALSCTAHVRVPDALAPHLCQTACCCHKAHVWACTGRKRPRLSATSRKAQSWQLLACSYSAWSSWQLTGIVSMSSWARCAGVLAHPVSQDCFQQSDICRCSTTTACLPAILCRTFLAALLCYAEGYGFCELAAGRGCYSSCYGCQSGAGWQRTIHVCTKPALPVPQRCSCVDSMPSAVPGMTAAAAAAAAAPHALIVSWL